MSVATVVAALQTLNGTITGVTSAPADMPDTLTADKLPCAITLPGPARWMPSGLGGARKCQRTYIVRFYIASTSEASVDVSFDLAFSIMEAAGALYRVQSSIGGCMVLHRGGDNVEDLGMLRTMAYAGLDYFGFEFRIPLLEES